MRIKSLGTLLVLCMIFSACQQTKKSITEPQCPAEQYFSIQTPPFTIDEVDTPAKVIGGLASIQREIQYPKSAMRERVQGEVLVHFIVDEQGCVMNAEVISGPDRRLNEEAVRVIQLARFEPAKKAGAPVFMSLTLPITFGVK